MMSIPLYSFLLVPILAAVLQLILLGNTFYQRVINLISTATLTVMGVLLVVQVKETGPVLLDVGKWVAPIGIQLQADMLSALMLVITGIVAFCGALHGMAEVPWRDERKGYQVIYQFLLLGVCGSFLTNDLFNLYVWFEVMLLSSFVLLAIGGEKPQIEGAVKYVALNILASLIFLLGLAVVYTTLGSLNFSDIAARIASGMGSDAGVRLAAVLLLIAFSVKAGLFPLYAWLPSSYHTPRHTVSSVFAGLLTKVGVYALIRTFGVAFEAQHPFVAPALWWGSLLTMVLGVLGAASQFHARRILSFHIISQIGYMTFALALGTAGAITAAIFYIIHHILVKTNLFFAAAAIDRIGGGEDLAKTGGLFRSAPWLVILFLISALSLGGIPPFSGFWAKLALIQEMVHVKAWVAAAIALLVGVFTLFSMTKIWGEAFWKDRPEDALPKRPISAAHVIPMILLAGGTVLLSLYPAFLFELAEVAAQHLGHTPNP